jgi:hypothetical protein
MAKQVLRYLDLAGLAVALDRAEEQGLTAKAPAPLEQPGDCVYLKYAGAEQLGALAARPPHVSVQLKTPGGAGRNKVIVKVFHKEAVLHVLGFLLRAEEISPSMRTLDTVDRRYWKVV